jgi:hypothetical protein
MSHVVVNLSLTHISSSAYPEVINWKFTLISALRKVDTSLVVHCAARIPDTPILCIHAPLKLKWSTYFLLAKGCWCGLWGLTRHPKLFRVGEAAKIDSYIWLFFAVRTFFFGPHNTKYKMIRMGRSRFTRPAVLIIFREEEHIYDEFSSCVCVCYESTHEGCYWTDSKWRVGIGIFEEDKTEKKAFLRQARETEFWVWLPQGLMWHCYGDGCVSFKFDPRRWPPGWACRLILTSYPLGWDVHWDGMFTGHPPSSCLYSVVLHDYMLYEDMHACRRQQFSILNLSS